MQPAIRIQCRRGCRGIFVVTLHHPVAAEQTSPGSPAGSWVPSRLDDFGLEPPRASPANRSCCRPAARGSRKRCLLRIDPIAWISGRSNLSINSRCKAGESGAEEPQEADSLEGLCPACPPRVLPIQQLRNDGWHHRRPGAAIIVDPVPKFADHERVRHDDRTAAQQRRDQSHAFRVDVVERQHQQRAIRRREFVRLDGVPAMGEHAFCVWIAPFGCPVLPEV